jgi:hypothetical protein
MTESEIVSGLAATNPIATIDYDPGYSEYTPGGPVDGCVFCRSRYASEDRVSGHEPNCIWAAARALRGLP